MCSRFWKPGRKVTDTGKRNTNYSVREAEDYFVLLATGNTEFNCTKDEAQYLKDVRTLALILSHKILNEVPELKELSREQRQTPEAYRKVHTFVENDWDFNQDYYEYFISKKSSDDCEHYEAPKPMPRFNPDKTVDNFMDNIADRLSEDEDKDYIQGIDDAMNDLEQSLKEDMAAIQKQRNQVQKSNNQIRIESSMKRYDRQNSRFNAAKLDMLNPAKRRRLADSYRRVNAQSYVQLFVMDYFGVEPLAKVTGVTRFQRSSTNLTERGGNGLRMEFRGMDSIFG